MDNQSCPQRSERELLKRHMGWRENTVHCRKHAVGSLVGTSDGDKKKKKKWSELRWTGPFEMMEKTSHAVQLKGKDEAG